MSKFTRELVEAVWPQWRPQECLLFQQMVLERDQSVTAFQPTDTFTRKEFLLIAIERWMALVLQMEQARRLQICRAIDRSNGLDDLNEQLTLQADCAPGFFLVIFNDEWVTWTGADEVLNLTTGEKRSAITAPIWQVTLNVTAMYFAALLQGEERMDAKPDDTTSEQPGPTAD
jgi:hypothetical protein